MSDSTPGVQARTLVSTGVSVERHHIIVPSSSSLSASFHLGRDGQTFGGPIGGRSGEETSESNRLAGESY